MEKIDKTGAKTKLLKYYKFGLIPVLVLWLIITFVSDAMDGAFFLLGFMWPYLYYTPGFEDKAKSDAYKYSFLGNVFKFQAWVFTLLGEHPKRWMISFARLIVPLLLTGIVSALNPTWTPLWSLVGWICFEGFVLLHDKYKWELM